MESQKCVRIHCMLKPDIPTFTNLSLLSLSCFRNNKFVRMIYWLSERIFYLFERFNNSSEQIFYSSERIFYAFERIFYSSERVFYLFKRFFYSFEQFTYSSDLIFYLFEQFFYSFERFTNSSERFFYLFKRIFYLFERCTNSSERRNVSLFGFSTPPYIRLWCVFETQILPPPLHDGQFQRWPRSQGQIFWYQ